MDTTVSKINTVYKYDVAVIGPEAEILRYNMRVEKTYTYKLPETNVSFTLHFAPTAEYDLILFCAIDPDELLELIHTTPRTDVLCLQAINTHPAYQDNEQQPLYFLPTLDTAFFHSFFLDFPNQEELLQRLFDNIHHTYTAELKNYPEKKAFVSKILGQELNPKIAAVILDFGFFQSPKLAQIEVIEESGSSCAGKCVVQ